MGQKFLIIPTQTFSLGVKAATKTGVSAKTGKPVYRDVEFTDLPRVVQMFISFFNKKIMIVVDEISWIKTTVPTAENKKSGRCRAIKLLEKFSEVRLGLTGTLLSKSPVNIKDPYDFLNTTFFEGTSDHSLAENYSIMMSLRAARGRRVMISQKEWDKARKSLIRAYKTGGDAFLDAACDSLRRDIGISREQCMHILENRRFKPFMNIEKLMKRVETITYTVDRADIFDISYDKKVYDPIPRAVELGQDGLELGKELIRVGFTDNIVLNKDAGLELMHRLKDLCNGFEPVREEGEDTKFVPLPENPKLEALTELLDEINTDENQVVVWVSRRNAFKSVTNMLEKEGIPFAEYRGGMSDDEKEETARKMRSGEARVFVGNPASAAFGLNFLAKVNYMVWYCVDTSVEKYHQAQHRILRGQSTTPKFAYMLYVKGSVEERNLRSVNAGVELLSASNTQDMFDFT